MSDSWERVKEIFEEAKGLVPKSERAASNLVLSWAIMELVQKSPQEMVQEYFKTHIQSANTTEDGCKIPLSLRDKLIPHRECFSERISNIFLKKDILTWGNLCDLGKNDLVSLTGFGEGCLTDVRRVLRQRGLFLLGEELSGVDGEFFE